MSRHQSGTPGGVLLQQQVRILAASVPLAALGDGGAVHRARVASRRLREVLPVVVKPRAGRALNRRVRRLTQALGPVRELDVSLALVAAFTKNRALSARAAKALKAALVRERAEARVTLARRLARTDIGSLGAALQAEARRTPRLAAAETRLRQRARRLAVAVEAAAGLYTPERLHAVRIAVKKLRYAEEVLVLAKGEPGSRHRVRFLTRVQDALGRMHDLDVLTASIRHLQASDAPSLGVSEDLDRCVRALDGECRRLHGEYMRLRDRLVALCRPRG